MDILQFARGPALQVAVILFFAGICWRLIHLILMNRRIDLSEARRGGAGLGGLRAVFSRFRHHEAFRDRTRNGSLLAYTMHIGLAVVLLGAAPHILFIESFTGLGWTPLPSVIVHVAAAATLAVLLIAIGRRLMHPVLRLISNFDDYFTVIVTTLPVLTGILAFGHVGGRYETLLGLHILSFDLFLVWFPFGKLMHSVIVFGSRFSTGAAFTRKGARV